MASYTTLRNGSSGSDVKKLQQALINAGYDVGSTGADGIYGAKTKAAVTAYQKANGLTVDGIAGNQTLGSLYSSKSTNTNSSKNTNITPEIKGVDQSLVDEAYNSSFKVSDDITNLETKKNDAYDKYNEHISQDPISQETMDAVNKKFEVSEAFTNAWASLQSQAQALQSGKTSWTDKYNEAIDKYLNREDFEYDVDKDPLFQQALASAMSSGKSAMQDTIGQASSLTGGYGSTYATTAGNQAYNAFIEDAYNNLPEYYQMALQAYQMEGEEMYNQVAMLGEADANEYQKMFNSFQVNSDLTQQMYNREFGEWEAGVNQAYNSANLQLNVYGQKSSDLYNSYDIASNEYENAYAKEWQDWSTKISNLQNLVGLAQKDYWDNKNYDQTEYWNDKNFNEGVRQFNYSIGDTNNDGVVSDSEKAAMNTTYYYDEKGNVVKGTKDETKYKTPSKDMKDEALAAYNSGGTAALNQYINSLPDDYEKDSIAEYVGTYGETWVKDYEDYSKYVISNDTKNGGFLGIFKGEDHDDEYSLKDEKGNYIDGSELTYDQLKEKINNSNMPKEKKKELLEALKKQSKQ